LFINVLLNVSSGAIDGDQFVESDGFLFIYNSDGIRNDRTTDFTKEVGQMNE
jgi:hypothetical protein